MTILFLQELGILGGICRNVELMEAAKPLRMDNEFKAIDGDEDGQISLENARYKTRVRRSENVCPILSSLSVKFLVSSLLRRPR